MKRIANIAVALAIAATPGAPDAAADPGADVDLAVTESIAAWNAALYEIAVDEDGLLTLKGLRTASMMHLAIHDALNTIDLRFERYAYDGPEVQADPAAAVTGAAFVVVAGQYPDRAAELRARRERELGAVGDRARVAAAVELGRVCAEAVIAKREGDRWNASAEYAWHPMAPGVYAEFNEHSGTPEGFVFGAGWAKAKPFVLSSPDQFRAPPPPAIDSDAYTDAFREVKRVGRFQSMSRAPEQTHIAMWWKDFVENSHNRLARQLVIEHELGPWPAARLFALLNMCVYDAYVCSFDNKFHFNHWRPYTAIRWAAYDGNSATEPDTLWDNTHRHTYAFPSYPSAHGMASASAMTALADAFGDETAFAMYTPAVDAAGPMGGKILMDPPTRQFERFSEAAMECAISRVYLGIHFRYDSIEGNRLGARVGKCVVENALRRID